RHFAHLLLFHVAGHLHGHLAGNLARHHRRLRHLLRYDVRLPDALYFHNGRTLCRNPVESARLIRSHASNGIHDASSGLPREPERHAPRPAHVLLYELPLVHIVRHVRGNRFHDRCALFALRSFHDRTHYGVPLLALLRLVHGAGHLVALLALGGFEHGSHLV